MTRDRKRMPMKLKLSGKRKPKEKPRPVCRAHFWAVQLRMSGAEVRCVYCGKEKP